LVSRKPFKKIAGMAASYTWKKLIAAKAAPTGHANPMGKKIGQAFAWPNS
jgi:hypothetical protein